jgi:hypothetical protein
VLQGPRKEPQLLVKQAGQSLLASQSLLVSRSRKVDQNLMPGMLRRPERQRRAG